MLCRTNTVETGDGGNNDLICSPYVHLFICLVPVAATPMYPLRRVVSTVAFEISCKFAWADETVYLRDGGKSLVRVGERSHGLARARGMGARGAKRGHGHA